MKVVLKCTLAISSLFFNSPSTMMTSPFPSTSVHRNRGSSAALAVRALRGKIEPVCSSMERMSSFSFKLGLPFLAPGPKSHSLHFGPFFSHEVFDSEELCRRTPPASILAGALEVARCLRTDLAMTKL